MPVSNARDSIPRDENSCLTRFTLQMTRVFGQNKVDLCPQIEKKRITGSHKSGVVSSNATFSLSNVPGNFPLIFFGLRCTLTLDFGQQCRRGGAMPNTHTLFGLVAPPSCMQRRDRTHRFNSMTVNLTVFAHHPLNIASTSTWTTLRPHRDKPLKLQSECSS